jgi:hypothetical protein
VKFCGRCGVTESDREVLCRSCGDVLSTEVDDEVPTSGRVRRRTWHYFLIPAALFVGLTLFWLFGK